MIERHNPSPLDPQAKKITRERFESLPPSERMAFIQRGGKVTDPERDATDWTGGTWPPKCWN